ncbi:hypothetical protein [Demequina salsinemoris]|uniref:hypothetical protein n=1 Tax=Demequina salsinemoris TaxID=577470 RepID=UPI0007864304|nr:hypothetical protein [Demequina salsinemoris]
MHPVAKRCLWWAAGLVAVGALFIAFGANIVYGFSEFAGVNAQLAVYPFAFLAQVITSFAMPLAATLVGAAIVIQTVAPKPATASSREEEADDTEEALDR